jgi:GNAT-family acetyltransferase (TIGR03103 family)
MVRDHRCERGRGPSVLNWKVPSGRIAQQLGHDAIVECGWGRLMFGHTFKDGRILARTLCDERPGRRDIAMYLRDPHVVISLAPQEVFLDPSHTFRLWLDRYHAGASRPRVLVVRKILSHADGIAINDIYAKRKMVTVDPDFIWSRRDARELTYVVVEDPATRQVVGTATGVDHVESFGDVENGSSLWCLAVDPQASQPGIGEALVRFLAEHYLARGRAFLDLSVMHDNTQAIGLYEKLGFVRVPVFAIKHKNTFNEPLFVAPRQDAKLNPYAEIIVREARRRGICVEVLDEEQSYFALTLGGRSIVCRESLSELTSAIAMSRCDDKSVTRRVLERAGLNVAPQQGVAQETKNEAFLTAHGRVVVKPARGEQGAGISVDLRDPLELENAIVAARKVSSEVLLEAFVEGEDLRIVVINFEVVAAAVRRPPQIVGTGQHSIEYLIENQSRRRAAATGGESHIPLDDETRRCVRGADYRLDSVLPAGETLTVRKTANLHTGGTIHDVTAALHPKLAQAAVQAARAINIPVVGLDFLVPDVAQAAYVIIEANERPGLANHEPQPTAERFVDLLFPETAGRC